MRVQIFSGVFFLDGVHPCVSKQWFSDPRPSTLYLYLLSALFSFCWARGTELWNQWAAACTNSLGSAVRLLNPFQHSLTLMSPARLLQTSLEECKTDTHTNTQTHTPLNTTSPLRTCLMMLFCATRLTPDPMTSVLSCPSPPPRPFLTSPLFRLPSQIPEGASLAMSLKDKKENTLGRGTSPSNTPISSHFDTLTHTHLSKHTHSLDHIQTYILASPREHDTFV